MKQAMTPLKNHSLKAHNTFGMAVTAELFTEITEEASLIELLSDPSIQHQPLLILGGGSNILFTRAVKGLVLLNHLTGFEVVEDNEKHVWLKIATGENWHRMVEYTITQGWQGLENLALIPGSVGAAPIQNIGAYGVELKEVLAALEAIELKTGKKHFFSVQDCELGYRHSIFKKQYKEQFFITAVTLKLNKIPHCNISYKALKEQLDKSGIHTPSPRDIFNTVIKIRSSKLPNPAVLGNAGSFFKNPVIAIAKIEQLQKSYPTIPYFTQENTTTVKISAAWLIEQAGLKGKRFGNVGVHERQALVLVNYGEGSGSEVKALAELIQNTVQQQFDILLETEVNIV